MVNLDRLQRFPDLVREIVETLPDTAIRVKPDGGGFTLVEQAWHLADLEVDGYTIRIARLLAESDPAWPDFDGDAVAKARRYIHLDLRPALRRFFTARHANVRRLRSMSEDDWLRSGTQEGVGRVTLARVAEMMGGHDAGHAVEIAGLLRQLGLPVPNELSSYEPPMEKTA